MLQNLNLQTNPLHSQMPQKARLRSIERFTGTPQGKSSILVATDVAARGLDIPEVKLVVNVTVSALPLRVFALGCHSTSEHPIKQSCEPS